MSAHLFTTIGNEDWSRELRASRSRPNVVRQMIAERIRNLVTPSRQATPQRERAAIAESNARRPDVSLVTPVQVVGLEMENREHRSLEMSGFVDSTPCQTKTAPAVTVRTNFAAAGSADREGAGTPRAESGGGESTFERSQPRTLKANEPGSGACENNGNLTCSFTGLNQPRSGRSEV